MCNQYIQNMHKSINLSRYIQNIVIVHELVQFLLRAELVQQLQEEATCDTSRSLPQILRDFRALYKQICDVSCKKNFILFIQRKAETLQRGEVRSHITYCTGLHL